MQIAPWNALESIELLKTRIFTLRSTRAQAPSSGRTHDFTLLDAPDWVNVIPITPDENVVLIRQYRHGTAEVTTEVPGGTVDPGEAPMEAARRELAEETGYVATEWESIGLVEPNPAFLTNRTHTFLARGARQVGPQRPDDSEEIEVVLWPLARIGELLRNGTIKHALVMCAFSHLALRGGLNLAPDR